MEAYSPKGPWKIEALLESFNPNATMQLYFDLMAEYGAIYKIPTWKTSYNITDPLLAKHVLKTNVSNYPRAGIVHNRLKMLFGDTSIIANNPHWKHRRQTLQLGFNKNLLNLYANKIATKIIPDWLNNYASLKKPLNITNAMQQLSLDIASQCLINKKLPPKIFNRIFQAVNKGNKYLMLSINFGKYTPTIGNILFQWRLWRLHQAIEQIISNYSFTIKDPTAINALSQHFNYNDFKNELKVLLITGQVTTGSALAFSLYELSKLPELQQQLALEFKSVINNVEINYDIIKKLPLSLAVAKEVLRRYPPLWNLQRKAINDDYIDNIFIKAKSTVNINIFSIHHNPDYWHKPQQFDPYRFLDKSPDNNNIAFIPFGIGQHSCIGQHLAILELVLIQSMLSYNFNWNMTHQQQIVQPHPYTTLCPPEELFITLKNNSS